MWIVIAKSCYDCGDSTGIKAFSHEPSETEKQEVATAIGGMFCIQTSTFEVEVDGKVVEE